MSIVSKLGHALLLLAAACSSGGEGASRVFVDLRTDYEPGVEFDLVEVSVSTPGGALIGLTEHAARDSEDFVEGVRVATFELSVPGPELEVGIRLFSPSRRVDGRRVRLEVRGDSAIEVAISRSCRGVSCEGDPGGATACLGGRCVDPRCAAGDESFCPPASCSRDADCAPPSGGCGAAGCRTGVCFYTDDGSCAEEGAALYCDPAAGCRDVETLALVRVPCVDAEGCAERANATPTCDAGRCVYACEPGFDDCDGDPETGCETPLGTADDCGGCGDVCAWGACDEGVCDDPVAIDVSVGYACALTRSSGSVACWGSPVRSVDGVGDGTGLTRSVPTWIAIAGAEQLAVGAYTSCAWGEETPLRCWGGGPIASSRRLPSEVDAGRFESLVLDRNDFQFYGSYVGHHVGTDAIHGSGCLVRADGTLDCWSALEEEDPFAGPRTWPGLTLPRVDEVGLTSGAGCARGDGSVECWRLRGEDPCGFCGEYRLYVDEIAPVELPDVVALAAGESIGGTPNSVYHCAIDVTGDAWCWGQVPDGNETMASRLGADGAWGTAAAPVRVEAPGPIRDLSLGSNLACAIYGDEGRVACWGIGRLGDGTVEPAFVPRDIGIEGAVDVAAGNSRACLLTSEGHVACWGHGPIGSGTDQGALVPTRVRPPPVSRPQTCGGEQVDLLRDDDHCGGCERACGSGSRCIRGFCACEGVGRISCDGRCIDVRADDDNCGHCDRACPDDRQCRGGSCVRALP